MTSLALIQCCVRDLDRMQLIHLPFRHPVESCRKGKGVSIIYQNPSGHCLGGKQDNGVGCDPAGQGGGLGGSRVCACWEHHEEQKGGNGKGP
jgi:hypothetical protein